MRLDRLALVVALTLDAPAILSANQAAAGALLLRCEATRVSRVPLRRPERLTYLYRIDTDFPKIELPIGQDICAYGGIYCYKNDDIVGYHTGYVSIYHGWPGIIIEESFSISRKDGELSEDYSQTVPAAGGGRVAVVSESIRGRCKRISDPTVPRSAGGSS